MLDRKTLLGFTQRRFAEVALPDGSSARIRSLTESEKSEFEASVLTSKGAVSVGRIAEQRRRLLVRVLCDERGNAILTDDDLPRLREIDGRVTSILYTEARKHCGFEDGDIEELVKNSEKIPDDAAPTA